MSQNEISEVKRASYKIKTEKTVGTLIISNQRILFQNKKGELLLNAFYNKQDALRTLEGGFELVIAVSSKSTGFRKKDNKLVITLNSNVGNRPITFDTENGQAKLIDVEITNAYQERNKELQQINSVKENNIKINTDSINSKIPANIPKEKIWNNTWYDEEFRAYVSLNENLKKEYDYKTELYEKYLKKTGIDAFVVKKELVEMIHGYPGIIHPTNKKELNRHRLLPTIPEKELTEELVDARIRRVFAGDIKYDTEEPRFWDRSLLFVTYPVTEGEYQLLCENVNGPYNTKEERENRTKEGDEIESFENKEYMAHYRKDIFDGLSQWFTDTKITIEQELMEKITDEMIKLLSTMDSQQYKEELQLVEHENGFQSMIYTPHSFRRIKVIEIDGQKITILVQLPNEVAVYLDETMTNEHMLRCSTIEKTWRVLIGEELDDSIQRQKFAKAIIENNIDEAKKIRNYVLDEKFEKEKYPYSVAFPKAYDLALAVKDETHIKTLENS